MGKTYADLCLERAAKATEGPWKYQFVDDCMGMARSLSCNNEDVDVDSEFWIWEQLYGGDDTRDSVKLTLETAQFIVHSRSDVPELARRLKKACDFLRYVDGTTIVIKFADELEAIPGEE